jgi:hypothetical protein
MKRRAFIKEIKEIGSSLAGWLVSYSLVIGTVFIGLAHFAH